MIGRCRSGNVHAIVAYFKIYPGRCINWPRFSGRDLKSEPPEYMLWMLRHQPTCIISVLNYALSTKGEQLSSSLGIRWK
jgi:hypothetical protein